MNEKKQMTVLIVGASGATGRHLTQQLLARGHRVRAIVRSPERVPAAIRDHANLSLIQAAVLDLSDAELAQHVAGCDAVASCLGHNVSFKGIYGHPRRLVTDAVRRLSDAIQATSPASPVKFVLMNTTGNSNRDLVEPLPFAHRAVIALLRLVLPPHVDNEQAADYLRTQIGQNHRVIQWSAVRPDGLIDEEQVSPYMVVPSPTRSAILDPGQVSRINVGHFMADLVTEDDIWRQWQGQMPVIYSAA